MRVFSKEELAQLRGFPEITRDELIRFFTLTPADRAFVDPGRGRSPRDRLGLAIQLCSLSWLGFVPDVVTAAPPAAVARLAWQLQVDPGELDGYGEREQTRTDHLRLVLRYCGWQTAGMLEFKELEEFLLARGMEHDAPSLLAQCSGPCHQPQTGLLFLVSGASEIRPEASRAAENGVSPSS
jgi:hypothetical protein